MPEGADRYNAFLPFVFEPPDAAEEVIVNGYVSVYDKLRCGIAKHLTKDGDIGICFLQEDGSDFICQRIYVLLLLRATNNHYDHEAQQDQGKGDVEALLTRLYACLGVDVFFNRIVEDALEVFEVRGFQG